MYVFFFLQFLLIIYEIHFCFDEFSRFKCIVSVSLLAKQFLRFKTFDQREPVNGGPSLINPYNLEIVSEKVDDNNYKSTVEFLKDIRQIRHNAEIVMTGKGKWAF